MRADSTFVNMKDVDITDQGPDTGNNDIAVLRGAEWGGGGRWKGKKWWAGGWVPAGLSPSLRDTFFLKKKIVVIVLNFHSVLYLYNNTNKSVMI